MRKIVTNKSQGTIRVNHRINFVMEKPCKACGKRIIVFPYVKYHDSQTVRQYSGTTTEREFLRETYAKGEPLSLDAVDIKISDWFDLVDREELRYEDIPLFFMYCRHCGEINAVLIAFDKDTGRPFHAEE